MNGPLWGIGRRSSIFHTFNRAIFIPSITFNCPGPAIFLSIPDGACFYRLEIDLPGIDRRHATCLPGCRTMRCFVGVSHWWGRNVFLWFVGNMEEVGLGQKSLDALFCVNCEKRFSFVPGIWGKSAIYSCRHKIDNNIIRVS